MRKLHYVSKCVCLISCIIYALAFKFLCSSCSLVVCKEELGDLWFVLCDVFLCLVVFIMHSIINSDAVAAHYCL